MFKKLNNYKTVGVFAKEFIGRRGKKGVTASHIHGLINKEKAEPGSTGLDVLYYDDVYLVRYTR